MSRESALTYYRKNREKALNSAKKWRQNNPEKAKASRRQWYLKNKYRSKEYSNIARWKSYGIRDATPKKYQALIEQQKGLCAVCGKENPVARKLCWDHDHKSGQARGLLCHTCNYRLGHLEHLLEHKQLLPMLDYLIKWSSKNHQL